MKKIGVEIIKAVKGKDPPKEKDTVGTYKLGI